MDSVIWLKDIGSQQEGIGHKAKVNADLFQAGFTVPDGFVICADAFNISEQQLVTVGSGGTTLVEKFPYLKPDIRPQLKEHLTTLGDAENKFAVRSSGIGEDGDRHSFAGQFMSFLNVEPQQVVQKAIDVWKSAQSDQLFAYCSSHQLNKSPQSIAVLVQQMVQADISGVAFGADPVSGRRNVVVINAVAELGDRLMAGSVTGQTYEVNRLQQISQRPAETALLTDTQVFEIAELVRRVGEYFGSPQDVEWAIADNTLYLLQARPITTLHQLPNPEGNFQLWDNSNIVESYSGITTPLTFSFARKAYTEVYKQFCRFMGVPDQEIAKNQRIFRNMIGLIRGRIYYNLLNWYRLLAMLPAAKLNARFMEQMMGVKEGLPDEVLTEIQTLAQSKTWGDRWRMILTFGQLLLNFLNLDRRIIRYHQCINKAVTLKATETRPADMTQWHMHMCH